MDKNTEEEGYADQVLSSGDEDDDKFNVDELDDYMKKLYDKMSNSIV